MESIMRRYHQLLLAVAVLGAMPLVSQAAKVKVWHQSKPGDFDKARLQSVVISNEGALRLSRELKSLTNFGGETPTHVWDIVEDKAGNLYVATGDNGKIFKIGRDGKVSVAYSSDDSQILCLAQGPDGSVFAGTGPGGRIIHINPEGQAKQIAEGLDNYVWSLAVDSKGENIYAGTGPKGRIHKVMPDGKTSVFYQSKQDHVLCVRIGPDGQLYAGTDKSGLVYRIDTKGKGFVLFQAAQSEVRTLTVTTEGIYVGTSAPTKSKRGGAGGATSGGDTTASSGETGAPGMVTARTKTSTETKSSDKPASKEETPAESKPASAPSTPGTGENSLYFIRTDGTVRELFRDKTLIMSVLKIDGRLLIGTGMDGQLFEIDEKTKERSEIARLEHGQILSMCKRSDGSIVLGAGDPGKLYVLEDRHTTKGTITSDVHDAKLLSKWGSLRWQADTPEGTRLTISVRTGNVAEPDDTWSDWSEEQTDREKAVVSAPAARFAQYRVTMTTENTAKTPTLRTVTVRYMNANQSPELTKLEAPELDAVNQDNPKKVKFKWTATDSNEDELTYNLYVRKDGWKSWVLIEEDFDKTEYEWDTTTTPSGQYQLKVVASDRKDNDEKDALTGEKISGTFVVNHIPPTVQVKVSGIEGGRVTMEASASSSLVRLTNASFSLNGKKWTNVFPTDELFDSKTEAFTFKTDGLKPGTYVVVLRVKDAAGNTGSADVVFTVQPKP